MGGINFMKTLTLKNRFQANATLLPNEFIDNYMAEANGEFVKVYLFLLRHLGDPSSSITVSSIADSLNNTEKDILRAFRYWESIGLLRLEYDAEGRIAGLELQKTALGQTASSETAADELHAEAHNPATGSSPAEEHSGPEAPGNTSASALRGSAVMQAAQSVAPMDAFRAQKELKSLLFIAEQYLGKTLSRSDVDAITYFYDTLHMSADLIEYLIESCVENGHKSMHYIQKVAFSWVEEGISTVSQAKESSALYNRNCYAVLNAFGIKNRGPASSELVFIKKWVEDYGFSAEIIQEACRRTISATHQPSFEYADTILTKWRQNNIRHLNDISILDEAYQKEKSARKSIVKAKNGAKNMNNFERRRYDMDALEEQLLNSN